MTEVRRYRIIGEIKKGRERIPFRVEYNAVKEEHALQRVYSEMGSRHGARRSEITITRVEPLEGTSQRKE